jgi:hypothetical protein
MIFWCNDTAGNPNSTTVYFNSTAVWPVSMNSAQANATVNGTGSSDTLGASVAAGDINGDGFDDLIIGAFYADPNGKSAAGQAYVFFGSVVGTPTLASWNDTQANITINGSDDGINLGRSVSSGDVNNDGYDDIIVGADVGVPNEVIGAGQVFVFFGNSTSVLDGKSWDSTSANVTLNGSLENGWMGYSTASGDINNDTYDDIIIGSVIASPN